VSVATRSPAYQTLADEIRAQITSGELRPGDRLPTEPELGQRTGVSRSTVREALRQLASQHLIVTTRGVSGGSFVAHPTPAQLSESLETGVHLLHASAVVGLADLLEARRAIDPAVAGFAAQRRTDEQLAGLRGCMFDPVGTDLSTMVERHTSFHHALARACGNPVLELISRPLQTVDNAQDVVTGMDMSFWTQVDADHRRILAAVTAGSIDAARRAAAAHVEHLWTMFIGPGEPARAGQPATSGGA
jgi:GntR family transcriptional repressor for pyruvate dehydrogenase complex